MSKISTKVIAQSVSDLTTLIIIDSLKSQSDLFDERMNRCLTLFDEKIIHIIDSLLLRVIYFALPTSQSCLTSGLECTNAQIRCSFPCLPRCSGNLSVTNLGWCNRLLAPRRLHVIGMLTALVFLPLLKHLQTTTLPLYKWRYSGCVNAAGTVSIYIQGIAKKKKKRKNLYINTVISVALLQLALFLSISKELKKKNSPPPTPTPK